MKKILLLSVMTLFATLFVGDGVKARVSRTPRAEKVVPTEAKLSENAKEQADTTSRNNEPPAVPIVGNNLVYIPTPKASTSFADSLNLSARRPSGGDSVVVASLKPASDSVRSILRNGQFKSVIIWKGGRDRFGNFTEECAAHANGRLRKFGIYSYGHAYQIPSHFHPVVNGYLNVKIPNLSKLDSMRKFVAVLDTHRRASDYIRDNFDIATLNTKCYYVVNMYYCTSPHMLEFFVAARNQGTNNYGTHVGVLYFDKKSQDWVVEHNIHGNVYRNSLKTVIGGRSNPHKFGVTTIYRASPAE